MRYTEPSEYFKNNEIMELLEDCKSSFAEIRSYRDKFRERGFVDIDDYAAALDVLTGLYMFVEEIYSLAQAYKEICEDEAHHDLRLEAEKSGTKITADALKVEAHRSVSLIIRVRNEVEAHKNSCEKAIITIQSNLNRMTRQQPGSGGGNK
jgi:hypothetical protein